MPLHSHSPSHSHINQSRLSRLYHSPTHTHTLTQTPCHAHASLTFMPLHPHIDTLSRSRLSHSHAYLTHPLHSHSVLSGMIFLLCDFFMWVCCFCSKMMIDLIVDCTILELVSCVTLFGSQENARKIFHFVLRLQSLIWSLIFPMLFN